MGIANTLKRYLDKRGIAYNLVVHAYAEGSYNTARVAKIPPQQLAKAVLFRDEDFNYILAVIPGSHRVKRYTLNQIFDRHLELADETEVANVFKDCSEGAVPALGKAYNVNVIWDEELCDHSPIWIEAGDHHHLIELDDKNFKLLMGDALHDHFSSTQRYRRPPPAQSVGYQYRSDANNW